MLRRLRCRHSDHLAIFLTGAHSHDVIQSTWAGGDQSRGIPEQCPASAWNQFLAPLEQCPHDSAPVRDDCLTFVSVATRPAQPISETRCKFCRSRLARHNVDCERVYAL